MRIDLTDLARLTGIAAALARLFWCLIVVAFLAAILGSAGTGLLVLILAGASFVARAGFEDFVRSRGWVTHAVDADLDGDGEIAIRRSVQRRAKSAV